MRASRPAKEDLTPEQRVQRARLGGLSTAARHDPKDYTAAAHAGFLAKFEREVDPDGVLPESERRRRAEAARKLHMQQLAWRSATARRKRGKSTRRGGS